MGCPRAGVVSVEDGGSTKLVSVGGASETARGGHRRLHEGVERRVCAWLVGKWCGGLHEFRSESELGYGGA